MKGVVSSLLALAFFSMAFADEPVKSVAKSPVPGVSDEEWTTLTPKERMMRAVGGMIPNKTTGEGCVALIDAQSSVGADFLKKKAEKLEDVSWYRFNYVKDEKVTTLANIDQVVKNGKGNVSIVVVEIEGLPRVMSLPESRAVVVNAAVMKDADQKKLEERVSKEIARAFGFAFGVVATERPGVMDRVADVSDLDAMLVDNITQEVVFEIERVGDKFGLRRFGRIMYKHACEQGIAPQPKNKWQQRIFEEVKAQRDKGASKVLKIEFDPKTGK